MYIYRSCSHRIYRTKSKYLVLQPLFDKYISIQQLGKWYWLYVNSKWISLKWFFDISDKIFLPFELNDSDHQYGNDRIDPDLNYFRTFDQYISHYNYFVESSFNSEICKCSNTKQHFSMCHLNIRSIRKNLDCFKRLMDDLQHEFSLPGVTETWLKDDDCALFDIEGYNMVEKHRQNQSGGGVAIYIKDYGICSTQWSSHFQWVYTFHFYWNR